MIRFRIGQQWKSERALSPVDAFGLELDGVDILSGASEESLLRVVPELVEAVHALRAGERLAQVSLPDANLELALDRSDGDVDLEVVSMSRPARRLRGPIRVDLDSFADAAVRCARVLMADLREHAPDIAAEPSLRTMLKTLQLLETRPRAAPGEWAAPFEEGHTPDRGFGFRLEDKRGRLLDFNARQRGGLASVLVEGVLTFRCNELTLLDQRCHPFLAALELSRQGGDLLHALEVGDPKFTFRPAGLAAEWVAELSQGTLTVGKEQVALSGLQLASDIFDLGQSLAASVIHAHKAHTKNPYVQELMARCREGALQLRAANPKPAPPGNVASGRGARSRKPADEPPIADAGRLRRLRFEQRWATEPLGLDQSLRLELHKKGPVVYGAELAIAYSNKGRVRYRRASVRGVALNPNGHVITATADRVLGFVGDNTSATWMRDHDGIPVGPQLFAEQGLWITTSKGRSLLAFDALTGREVWRVAPSRTQKMFLCVADGRVIAATDGGHLYGLSLSDGSVLYRLRAAQPFDAPVHVVGRKILARVGSTDRATIISAELQTGAVHWTRDLPLSRATQPLAARERIYVAGEQGGDALVVALSKKGVVAWDKRVHLGAAPYSLASVKRAVIVSARNGAAALVDSDGRVVWRIGAPSRDEIACDVPAVISRGVAIIAGPVVRAVDVTTGEVLAEVKSDPGLCDLKVDRSLGLFLLYEDGTLAAYELTTHLAVIESP